MNPRATWADRIRMKIRARQAKWAQDVLMVALERNPHMRIEEILFERIVCGDAKLTMDVLTARDPVLTHRQFAFAQEGEDLILSRILGSRSAGFFVDVGACHPVRFSNTYLLYRQGWRGINIDATPGAMRLFDELRPEDVNLEAFVGAGADQATLYQFNEPALNTASSQLAAERQLEPSPYNIVQETSVEVRSLASILDEYLPPERAIDFLNVDVEGAELGVLRSNDWARYRPEWLLVEQLATDLQGTLAHETARFLSGVGYDPAYRTYNTVFFHWRSKLAETDRTPA